jgi:hypothetical protein
MNEAGTRKFSSLATSSKKSAVKQITVDLVLDEAKKLENYCNQTGKAAKDVIQELIQGLPTT